MNMIRPLPGTTDTAASPRSLMKESAGTLLYRRRGAVLEVLLVHASGHYNRGKPWGIPKGIPDKDEPLEDAARRETWEETGVAAARQLVPLGSVVYRASRKRIHCFAGEAPFTAHPCCASWEVDRAEFVDVERARELIHPDQAPFLDRLHEWLASLAERTGIDVPPR